MIAAILAKRSERFPGKHMKQIGGETMIGTVARTLAATGIFEEVIVFTKDSTVRTDFASVLPDSTDGTAIDSIISLLEKYGEVFVAAGDMPLISSELVSEITSGYHGIPIFPMKQDGRIEPLLGIYNQSMIDTFRSMAESGEKKLRTAIEACRHETVAAGAHEWSLFNVNLESDLEKLLRKRS